MKKVLITGLDGSGKSTILKALSSHQTEKNFDIIYLPHLHPETLSGDERLKTLALCINDLNKKADIEKLPQLKALALFASMLIFEDIVELKSKEGYQTIFCERHPLIDAAVYAHFYVPRLKQIDIPKEILRDLNLKYNNELKFIYTYVSSYYTFNNKGNIENIIEFIYKWFYTDQRTNLSDLQELFRSKLPDKIFFLKAEASLLFSRIAERKVGEAHETEEVMSMLSKVYDNLFSDQIIFNPQCLEIIDANHSDSLKAFQDKLIFEY